MLASAAGYFQRVISIADLIERADDGRVVFDKTGATVDIDPPDGSAVLIVSEMTDALKTVDTRLISGSVDRGQVWVVDAIALDVEVLDRLDGTMPIEDLIEAVRVAGFDWQVSPTFSP